MPTIQQQLRERNQRMQARNHNHVAQVAPHPRDPSQERNPPEQAHAQHSILRLNDDNNATQLQQLQHTYQQNMNAMQQTFQQNMNEMHRQLQTQQQFCRQNLNAFARAQRLQREQDRRRRLEIIRAQGRHHNRYPPPEQQQQNGQMTQITSQIQSVQITENGVLIRTSGRNAQNQQNHNYNHNQQQQQQQSNLMNFNYPAQKQTHVYVDDGILRRHFVVLGSFVVDNGDIRAHNANAVRELQNEPHMIPQQHHHQHHRNPRQQQLEAEQAPEQKQDNEVAQQAMQRVVSVLPVRVVNAEEIQRHAHAPSTEEEYECQICMERYKETDTVMTLPCFHEYHERCIRDWLQHQTYCPVCMHEVYRLV